MRRRAWLALAGPRLAFRLGRAPLAWLAAWPPFLFSFSFIFFQQYY